MRSAIRNFIYGYGSILRLQPPPMPPRKRRVVSDAEAWARDGAAIAGDWRAVGRDMRSVTDPSSQERGASRERK